MLLYITGNTVRRGWGGGRGHDCTRAARAPPSRLRTCDLTARRPARRAALASSRVTLLWSSDLPPISGRSPSRSPELSTSSDGHVPVQCLYYKKKITDLNSTKVDFQESWSNTCQPTGHP